MKHLTFLLVIICLFIGGGKTYAGVIQAASTSRADIQAAINSASDGDIVVVPAGISTWTSRVTISAQITLQGAGQRKTVITKTGGDYALYANGVDNLRITGFTIRGGNYSSNGINLAGNPKGFRIDNNKFTQCTGSAVQIRGYAKGVIDHNNFIDNQKYDVVIYGDNDAGWQRPINLGTDEAVYVEDNYFEHTNTPSNAHSIASNHGSRYVFRYNTINDNGSLNTVPIDAHGNCYYGRGSVSYEIYNNTINSEHSYNGMGIRGGTGVIFGNTYIGDFTNPIYLTNYRSWKTNCSTGGIVSAYPAPDQINNLYIWGNIYNEQPLTSVTIASSGYAFDHIQEDRDYYSERPSYTPYVYPHPLTGGADTTSPSPPSNLRIVQLQ